MTDIIDIRRAWPCPSCGGRSEHLPDCLVLVQFAELERRKRRNSHWLIFFEDAERKPEVFGGEDAEAAAREALALYQHTWNCHLFVEVCA